MTKPSTTDEEFIALWHKFGSPQLISNELGVSVRNICDRRKRLAAKLGIELPTHNDQRFTASPTIRHSYDKVRSIADITGTVFVFSDAHFQPNESTTAFYALLKLIKRLKPALIVANGDILDGALISRYGAEDWSNKPTLQQELEAIQVHMDAIHKACKGLGTILHRTIGNHDIRFDKRLANAAPEFKGIKGTTLVDHIPEWSVSWSVMVNANTMIKHRMQHGGIHSGYNNTLKSGVNSVTGHTHLLEVKPWGDYTGRRYGVSTGMLACPDSNAFSYMEDNPRPWCSGFAVLTFTDEGMLLPPELCEVIDNNAYFRGAVVS